MCAVNSPGDLLAREVGGGLGRNPRVAGELFDRVPSVGPEHAEPGQDVVVGLEADALGVDPNEDISHGRLRDFLLDVHDLKLILEQVVQADEHGLDAFLLVIADRGTTLSVAPDERSSGLQRGVENRGDVFDPLGRLRDGGRADFELLRERVEADLDLAVLVVFVEDGLAFDRRVEACQALLTIDDLVGRTVLRGSADCFGLAFGRYVPKHQFPDGISAVHRVE